MMAVETPRKILGRLPYPILEPETDYGRDGLVPTVVFPCGNVVINGELFVYYGAADKYCSVATCRLEELVDAVVAHPLD